MKRINLSHDQVTIVDNCDYDYLIQWKWSYNGRYASRKLSGRNGKRLWMHLIIFERAKGNVPLGYEVDHINLNRLDNCRKNLRLATDPQQGIHKGLQSNNTSGVKGINFLKRLNKWQARIKVNQKNIYLGVYVNIEDAAKAYNDAATKYFGEFAWLNPL